MDETKRKYELIEGEYMGFAEESKDTKRKMEVGRSSFVYKEDTGPRGNVTVVIYGNKGTGKTTFAMMLAECLEAELVNEEVFENPFLTDFYKNQKRHAFSCQLYFLIARFQQQQNLMTRDLFAEKIVADYLFAKDAIFASVNLSRPVKSIIQRYLSSISRWDIPSKAP